MCPLSVTLGYDRPGCASLQMLDPSAPLSPSKMAAQQRSEARRQQKAKRKEDEATLHAKRQEMDKAKVCHYYISLLRPL
jgi:hypothetical protein